MKKILILLFLVLCVNKLQADEVQVPSDTLSYRYKFAVGDTLIYAVMSKDSVVINWGDPLLRIRFEKIMLTCDSITPAGNYIIKQQLIDFSSKESFLEEKNVSRNTTPWLNIPAHIEIDSLGRRYKTYNDDTLSIIMSPGGAFQPFIIFPLDNVGATINKKKTKESWIVSDSLLYLPENGIPNPVLRTTFFYRLFGMVDTLELGKLLKMSFSVTSQGSVAVLTEDVKMLTTSVNNAGGEIFWDTLNWIPKYFFHTVEQRLTINDKVSNTKVPGFHYIHSTFVLDKFIRKP